MFIDDVIKATWLGIERPEATGQVFNVGTGVATTVSEVAALLISLYNTDTQVNVTGNYRLGDIRHNYADLSKIKQLLGFKPCVSFADGLRQFTDWVNTQSVTNSRYDESIKEMKEKGLMK